MCNNIVNIGDISKKRATKITNNLLFKPEKNLIQNKNYFWK